MSSRPALASWVLGLALLAGPTWGWEVAAALPRGAALLLIWIALAGLPQGPEPLAKDGQPGHGKRLSKGLILTLALMAPLLSLACALDRSAGIPIGVIVPTALCGVGLALALQLGAGHAARSLAVARRYGWAWLGLVVVLPVLEATAAWDGAPGGAGEGIGGLVSLSPLRWAFDRTEGGDFAWPLLPACLVAALLLIAASRPANRSDGDGSQP